MSTSSGSACWTGAFGGSEGSQHITPVEPYIPSLPLWIPPPRPVILFNLAEPPALIFASRFSFRSLACSAALEGGLLAGSAEVVGVSAMVFPAMGREEPGK